MAEVAKRTAKEKIYWGIVEFSANTQMIAQQLQLNQVPAVMLLSPGKQPVKCDLSSEQITEFIQHNTGISVSRNY
jgi:thioredoxin-like negative regulator of GroEL